MARRKRHRKTWIDENSTDEDRERRREEDKEEIERRRWGDEPNPRDWW